MKVISNIIIIGLSACAVGFLATAIFTKMTSYLIMSLAAFSMLYVFLDAEQQEENDNNHDD